MSDVRRHTTQSFPAYEPDKQGIGRGWVLVVVGLVLVALVAVTLRPVCAPDEAAATHAGFGVRHEQRGGRWYHCEPWISRALGDWGGV